MILAALAAAAVGGGPQPPPPFPAPPATLAAARSRLGVYCPTKADPIGAFPGFSRADGFSPVAFSGGYVLPLQKDGVRFAFLIAKPPGGGCRIADVATLPGPRAGEAFVQCRFDPAGAAGFGLRQTGPGAPAAYWSIDGQRMMLRPEPVGAATQPHCQPPPSNRTPL